MTEDKKGKLQYKCMIILICRGDKTSSFGGCDHILLLFYKMLLAKFEFCLCNLMHNSGIQGITFSISL